MLRYLLGLFLMYWPVFAVAAFVCFLAGGDPFLYAMALCGCLVVCGSVELGSYLIGKELAREYENEHDPY
jgi:hypothetical protein